MEAQDAHDGRDGREAQAPTGNQDRRRSGARRQRGFTLLELLITLTITTIGMLGVLSLHLSVGRGNDSAARSAESVTVAKDTMEWLRSLRYPDMLAALGNIAPALGTPVTVTLPTSAGRAGMTYRRQVVVTMLSSDVATGSELIRLRVEVSWTEDGAARVAGDGFSGGRFDHAMAFEFLRTNREAL